MVRLFKRGRVWYTRINLPGRCECRSLRTGDRSVAQILARHIEIDVLSGGKLREHTWREFALEFEQTISGQVRFRTLKYYLFVLHKLTAFFDEHRVILLGEVTPAQITNFIEARRRELHPSRKRTMTDGGVRAYFRVLHRIFSFAVQREYIRKNPVLVTNRNAIPGKTQPFAPDEITAMLTAPYLVDKAYLRAIVLLFLHTGLRIGDVIDLKKTDVDGAYLSLRARKNSTNLRLPIHSELRDSLGAYAAVQNTDQQLSPYLFSTQQGQPIVSLDKHLRRLWKACGIVGGHAHRFRDTFAVRLLETGASLYDVAKLLGISAVVVEAHYAPYVKELQERGRRLVSMLNYTTAAVSDSALSTLEPVRTEGVKFWRN